MPFPFFGGWKSNKLLYWKDADKTGQNPVEVQNVSQLSHVPGAADLQLEFVPPITLLSHFAEFLT